MNITPVNTNQNQDNQQSFGMKFSKSVKGDIKTYVDLMTPDIRNAFKELNAKKDKFVLDDITFIGTGESDVATINKPDYYNHWAYITDKTDKIKVRFKNTELKDKSLLGLLKALSDDTILAKLFNAKRAENLAEATRKAEYLAKEKEIDGFIKGLK